MYNGPSSTTHDPVMKRREYGRAEGERAGGGQDVQAFCLLGGKVKRGRCMLIEFSAGGGRDASTKSPQTDQDGRQSPQKKCTLIITTFFRTKRLVFSSPRMATCPRGDPLYRPPASLSHFRPPSLTCSSVSPFTIEPFLFALCRRIFLSALPHLSQTGIFENLPPSHRHSCRPLSGNWKRRAGDSRRRPLGDQRMSRSSWKKLTAVQMSSVDTGYCRK